MQLFGTKGQKFLHCPGTKGQAQNLAMGRPGPDFDVLPQDGPGGDRPGRDVLGFLLLL